MRVTINDKEIIFPSSLSEINLGQRIDFYNDHGKELDEMLTSILEMNEGVDKELEIELFHFEKMFRSFAFFAGTTVEAVKESQFIEDIANIYFSCLSVLMEDEENIEPKQSFMWEGVEWELDPPVLKNGDKRTFGEFIDAKQLVKDMLELGNGKWEYMLPICAIYLRKKGEKYKESFLYEDSERLKLMRSLPMDIAMQVGFFLSSTQNIYINTLSVSGNSEPRDQENIQSSILSAMVG